MDQAVIGGHAVAFYRSSEHLGDMVARFLAADGPYCPAVIVATPERSEAIDRALDLLGVRPAGIVWLDADALLETFMVDGSPSADRFGASVASIVAGAAVGGTGTIRVYGEMVDVLWARGRSDAAIALEAMWNDLARRQRFELLCGYRETVADVAGAGRVCRHHSAVIREHHGRATTTAWYHLEAATDAPAQARRFVADMLAQWDLGALADDAAVVISELATNAVLHARSAFSVTIGREAEFVEVGVHDEVEDLPQQRAMTLDAPGGRGLGIVSAMATQWGTDCHPGRKLVWAQLST